MKTWVMFRTSGDDGWGKKMQKKVEQKKSAKKNFLVQKRLGPKWATEKLF